MLFNDTAQIPSFVKTDQRIKIRKVHTNTHTYNIHIHMCKYRYMCILYADSMEGP